MATLIDTAEVLQRVRIVLRSSHTNFILTLHSESEKQAAHGWGAPEGQVPNSLMRSRW